MDLNTNYPTSRPSKFARYALVSAGLVLFLGATGAAAYFYKQYNSLQKDPNKAAAQDSQATIAAVGKLIVLPEGEQPTVATVTDPSKLGNQAFFVHAKVGDKVLLYSSAKKAFLYDPVMNKIVEVAPINLDDKNAPAVSGTANSGAPTDSLPKK